MAFKPYAPTGMKAVYSPDSHSVRVDWKLGARAVKTIIQRWNATFKVYSDVATVDALTYYIDTALTDAETYAYRGLSESADGFTSTVYSAPSNQVTILDLPVKVTELVAERYSSGLVGLGWKNNNTPLGPYDFHYIFRSSRVATTFAQIDRIVGTRESYGDAKTEPDMWYRYRVWTSNEVGGGKFHSDQSGIVYTIPAYPTNPRARWVGGDVLFEWDIQSKIADQYEVEHTTDGLTWDPMATLGKVQAWRLADAERGVGHRFRVRAWSPKPTVGGRVNGLWAMSAWLPAESTPDAPTITGPAFIPVAEPFDVQYVHNPASPNSPEGGVQNRWRRGGGAWSTPVDGPTVVAQATGALVEVQVRTKTTTSAYGEWSAPAAMPVRARPVPSLAGPANGSVATGPVVAATWTASGQVQFEVELVQGGQVVQAKAGTTAKTTTLNVADASTFTLRLRVFDGYLWSLWRSVTFTTAFTAPPVATLTVTPDRDQLSVLVKAAKPAGVARVEIQRHIVGSVGEWVPVGDIVGGQLLDMLAPLNVALEYVAVSYATSGASKASEVVTTTITRPVVAINYGPGLAAVATIELAIPAIGNTQERETVLHRFAGRTLPVEVVGDMITSRAVVSGRVVDGIGSPREVWAKVLRSDQRWFRDPTGQSFRCSIASHGFSQGAHVGDVSFTAEEVGA